MMYVTMLYLIANWHPVTRSNPKKCCCKADRPRGHYDDHFPTLSWTNDGVTPNWVPFKVSIVAWPSNTPFYDWYCLLWSHAYFRSVQSINLWIELNSNLPIWWVWVVHARYRTVLTTLRIRLEEHRGTSCKALLMAWWWCQRYEVMEGRRVGWFMKYYEIL